MATRRANIATTAQRNFRALAARNARNPFANMPATRAINAALRGRTTAGGGGGRSGGSGGAGG